MKSQTSLVAQQVRLHEWAVQIRECQSRPEGMRVEDWCSRQGITKATYYWRLRKVREAMLEAAGDQISFVELPPPVPDENITRQVAGPAAILKSGNSLTLEISNQASGEFLSSLLRAMIHAQ